MGRTLANLNMLYHHQRLVLLRFRFITAINDMIAANAAAEQLLGSKSNQILPITDQTIIECLNSASAITAINRAFIVSKPTGIEDKSTVHKMLVYHSALYHCCAAAATGDVFSMIPIVSIHVEAMKMIVRGPNFDKLQNCFADPAKAIRYLKGFVNCWVY